MDGRASPEVMQHADRGDIMRLAGGVTLPNADARFSASGQSDAWEPFSQRQQAVKINKTHLPAYERQ